MIKIPRRAIQGKIQIISRNFKKNPRKNSKVNKSGENSDNFKEFQEISCGKYPWKANQGKIQIISKNFRKNQGENIQGKQIRGKFR